MTEPFDTAVQAGEQAWHEGVPLSTVLFVASERARQYAESIIGLTQREWVDVVAIYGDAFISSYLAAGTAHAEETHDRVLAARLWVLDSDRPL